jgi:hypothetical protein
MSELKACALDINLMSEFSSKASGFVLLSLLSDFRPAPHAFVAKAQVNVDRLVDVIVEDAE